ncbi:GRTP1, partial [Symbiodinium necroappetens]
DVLGPDFFSRQPALLGYHGDRAAAAALVASQSPSLSELMGVQCLGESISALASRCLLSGFVGFLSGPPLVALWEELLQVRCADFPRLPLISWLAGLVHHAESQLASALVGLSSDEAVPVFFRTVQQAAKALPNNWRPRVRVSRAQVLELRQISKAAAEKYRSAQETLSLKEMHAKNVSASLDRTCSALLDAMKFAEGVSSASATGSSDSLVAWSWSCMEVRRSVGQSLTMEWLPETFTMLFMGICEQALATPAYLDWRDILVEEGLPPLAAFARAEQCTVRLTEESGLVGTPRQRYFASPFVQPGAEGGWAYPPDTGPWHGALAGVA